MQQVAGYFIFNVRFHFVTVRNCVHVRRWRVFRCWIGEKRFKVITRASKDVVEHQNNRARGQAFTK
jgi:hypothetical protein